LDKPAGKNMIGYFSKFMDQKNQQAFQLISNGEIGLGLKILKKNSEFFTQPEFEEYLFYFPDLLKSKDEETQIKSLEVVKNINFIPHQTSLVYLSEIFSKHKDLFKLTHFLILILEIILKLFVENEIFSLQFLSLVMESCKKNDNTIQRLICSILELYSSICSENVLNISKYDCVDHLVVLYQTTTSTILLKLYILRNDLRNEIDQKMNNFSKLGSCLNARMFSYLQNTFNFSNSKVYFEFFDKFDDSKIFQVHSEGSTCILEYNGLFFNLGTSHLTLFSENQYKSIQLEGQPMKFKVLGEFISILELSKGFSIFHLQTLFQGGDPIFSVSNYTGSLIQFFQVDQMMCHLSLLHDKTLNIEYFNLKGVHLRSNTIQLESNVIDACVNNDGTIIYLITKDSLKMLEFTMTYRLKTLNYANYDIHSKISMSKDQKLLSISGNSFIHITNNTGNILFKYKWFSTGKFQVFHEFSKVDSNLFFFFDEFSLKIFHIDTKRKSKDLSHHLVQIIPLRIVDPRVFFQSQNGKHLYFGNLLNGISSYRWIQLKFDFLSMKSFDLSFQFK
jgi:hypothetical protein